MDCRCSRRKEILGAVVALVCPDNLGRDSVFKRLVSTSLPAKDDPRDDATYVPMIEREVTIRNRSGLHTRPAATLVKVASRFKAELFIVKDEFVINGKSIIGVMTLAAEQGSALLLRFEGEDEQEAATAILDLFERGFDE